MKGITTLKQFDRNIVYFRKLLLNRVRARAYKSHIYKLVCQWCLRSGKLKGENWKLNEAT